MIKLKPTEKQKEDANKYAALSLGYTYRKLWEQRLRGGEKKNYENIYWGRLARTVISKWLDDNGIGNTVDKIPYTKEAEYYIRTLDGLKIQGRYIRNKPRYKHLLEEKSRMNTHPNNYYIAITNEASDIIVLLGFATYQDLKKTTLKEFNQGVLDHHIKLTELRPIDKFISLLKGELTIDDIPPAIEKRSVKTIFSDPELNKFVGPNILYELCEKKDPRNSFLTGRERSLLYGVARLIEENKEITERQKGWLKVILKKCKDKGRLM